jgi:hypothetical protein
MVGERDAIVNLKLSGGGILLRLQPGGGVAECLLLEKVHRVTGLPRAKDVFGSLLGDAFAGAQPVLQARDELLVNRVSQLCRNPVIFHQQFQDSIRIGCNSRKLKRKRDAGSAM